MEVQQSMEKEENASIEIELTFQGEPPTGLFVNTIQICEEEIYENLRAEMEASLEELNLPGYVKSVCRRRFTDTSGIGLRFTSARRGSIVLYAGLTALGYWIIQNTVGETLKDAYKDTGMHQRLKNLFLSRRRKQAEDLGSALTGRLVRYTSDAPAIVSVDVKDHGSRSVINITVSMSKDREQALPPTIDIWFGE